MLKALIKKQFLELNAFYFQNRKTGKNRSKGGIIGTVILYSFVFIFLAIMFAGMASLIAYPLISTGKGWLYFAMMGLMSILLGVFGGVFNTYAGLYHAKDNELLLSMPIPPSKILFARVTGVYGMGFLYEAIVLIPSIFIYWVNAEITVLNILFPILLLFIIGFLVMTLTCALGWVVALISSKLKNKSFITVIVSVVFFVVYYFVCFRLNSIIQSLIANMELMESKLKVIYPLYLMGLAADGKVLPMLGFTAMVAAVTALTYFVLSRTFIKIVTTKTAEKKTEYKAQTVKAGSAQKALFVKELKRFTSSPTYMLNTGLGLVIFVIISILALVKSQLINDTIAEIATEIPEISTFIPAAVTAVLLLMLSMNGISAPSVSLEGKNIWIVQSLPVNAGDILQAKQKLHIYLNTPVAFLAVIALGIAFRFEMTTIIYMEVAVISFVLFSSAFGLTLNLLKPNLSWTNETVPIKQSFSITVNLFSGWGLAALLGAADYFLVPIIGGDYCILAFGIIVAIASRFLNKWLRTKGARIFESL